MLPWLSVWELKFYNSVVLYRLIISPLRGFIAFCFELELTGLRTVAPHIVMLFRDAPEHVVSIYEPKRKRNHHNFPIRPSSERLGFYRRLVDTFKMINRNMSVQDPIDLSCPYGHGY